MRRTNGLHARVTELRWLAPPPVKDIIREAADATGRVLIVDETRRSDGAGKHVPAALVENGFQRKISCVASEDSFIPLAMPLCIPPRRERRRRRAGERCRRGG